MCPTGELLKDIPLFQLLDESEREALAAKLELVHFAAAAPVFQIGDPGDAIYIIASGEAEVFFKNDTGERMVLEHPGKGDFFGELSFLENGSRQASVCAMTEMETFRLKHADLREFLESRPHAAMHLLAAMSRRLRATSEQLRHTATRNVNEEVEDNRTVVQKTADAIAEFSGSIPFLLIHVGIFAFWLTVNSVHIPGIPQFDPFPFGFLTLAVSLEAIFLSVFVLLSQNRQAAKERVRADIEYDVNLKAELEVAHLHEKLDHIHCEMLSRLEKLQAAVCPPDSK
jgi:uncharacterized membrane protein